MFSFRQLGRILAKAPIESLRTCQVLGSKIQNQDFSSQTHVPNVKSYFSPVLIPTTNPFSHTPNLKSNSQDMGV